MVNRSFPFTMYDIIGLLGLPQPPANRNDYNIQCPECDHDNKKHLNINLQKGVFRCARCGFQGGMISLYERYSGCGYGRSYREIVSKLSLGEYISPRTSKPGADRADTELADIEVRDKVYSMLLKASPIRPEHRNNLHRRGLSDSDIQRLGYGSTPSGNDSIHVLLKEYRLTPVGVPGFYKQGDSYRLIDMPSGIMLPLMDVAGRIQGIQIRLDNAEKQKYRFLSSVREQGGCGAKAWVHVCGKVGPGCEVILTEGALKADVVNSITGKAVIAIPGVNAIKLLVPVLRFFEQVGIGRLMTAFDADFYTNEHVAKGYKTLMSMLDSNAFDYGTYLWDYRYKGIDDFFNAYRKKGGLYETDHSY